MILQDKMIEKYGYNTSLLKLKSDKICVLSCDYCGIEFERKYSKVIRGYAHVKKDACSLKTCQLSKKRESSLKVYGTEHPTQNKDVFEKRKQTFLNKFGVGNPFAAPEIKQKVQISKQSNKEREMNTEEENEEYTQEQELGGRTIFSCARHNVRFVDNIGVPKCPGCRVSSGSEEIFDFVKSLGANVCVNENFLHLVNAFVPEKNIGFEYRGLYKSSELHVESDYLSKRFLLAKSQGIKLVQLYEDEWRDKQDICKSMIRNKLGYISVKFHARKLNLVESDDVNRSLFKDFFNKNHLQGNGMFKKAFGLVDGSGELLLAISLRRPFIKRGLRVEVARLASKTDIVVVGGFSRLMKPVLAWCNANGFEKLITYSDCRYSLGETYEKYGFKFAAHTGKDYFYTDFIGREGRFKHRAQPGKPEKQVAYENCVYKLYGPGHFRWEIDLKT